MEVVGDRGSQACSRGSGGLDAVANTPCAVVQ
jgi:hypothetical protein